MPADETRPSGDEDAATGPTVGNPPLVFETIEAGMARFAKLNNPPRVAHDRERMLHALIKTEAGYMLKRDPDNVITTARALTARGVKTARGGVWTPVRVADILRR